MSKWNMPLEKFKKGALENYREGIRKGQKSFKVKKSIEYRRGIAGWFYEISQWQAKLK